MNPRIFESCIEKVYGYAVNHIYSRQEADELALEILITAVRALPRSGRKADSYCGSGEWQIT